MPARGGQAPSPMQAEVTHKPRGDRHGHAREPDRITVLFDEIGYKTLSLDAVGDVLVHDLAPASGRSQLHQD